MPPPPSLSNDLRIAVARLSRRLRRSVADETLGFPHMSALGTLHKCGPITLQDLSAKDGVTPPSMVRTVHSLVEHGYVERRPHETDGRKQLLEITESGHAMMDETRRQRNAWLQGRLDALDDDDRATLRRAAEIMDRLAESDS